MSPDISFEPSVTRSVGVSVDSVAGDAAASVAAFRSGLFATAMCWGTDQFGAAFASGYLPAAQDAALGAIEHANQLAKAAENLFATAGTQEGTEQTNAEAAEDTQAAGEPA